MSILSVDQIQPIGSGTTVTLNATEVKTGTEITVGTGASIFSPAGNILTLGTNNVERIRIKNDGKVGIGTNNPTAKLEIKGSDNPLVKIVQDTSGIARLNLESATNDGYQYSGIGLGDGTNDAELMWTTDGFDVNVGNAVRLRINSNGAWGAGTNFGTAGQVLTSQGSGSAVQWASVSASGTVIQTIKKPLSSNYTTSSGSFQDVTGLTQAITLSNSSNKVLIVAVLGINGYGDRDRRCATGLFHTNMNTSNQFNEIYSGEYHTGDSGSYSYGCHTHYVVDTPGSTSRTYKIGLKNLDGSTARVYGQTNSGTTDLSYILLQEITA